MPAFRRGASGPRVCNHHVAAAGKVHLTGKPISLLVDLLQVTPEGGVILDPFTGGGTTALACQQTGRRFIGVELSSDYFELASRRIQAAKDQPK